jgi:hypothetical protein
MNPIQPTARYWPSGQSGVDLVMHEFLSFLQKDGLYETIDEGEPAFVDLYWVWLIDHSGYSTVPTYEILLQAFVATSAHWLIGELEIQAKICQPQFGNDKDSAANITRMLRCDGERYGSYRHPALLADRFAFEKNWHTGAGLLERVSIELNDTQLSLINEIRHMLSAQATRSAPDNT